MDVAMAVALDDEADEDSSAVTVEPVTKVLHAVHRSSPASGLKKPSKHGKQDPAFHSKPAEQAQVPVSSSDRKPDAHTQLEKSSDDVFVATQSMQYDSAMAS
jgi:hypothetical protein